MIRGVAFVLVISTAVFFAQEPNREPDSFDIEPPLLIPNRDREPLSEAKPPVEVDLAKLEKQFERAKRNAEGAERFCRIGAISKVEAEQRILRVVQAEFDLANARLAHAKEEMLAKEDETTAHAAKAGSSETERTLALAIEAAHAAAAKRARANLDAAEANVQRQQKLLALGSGRKSDVQRAVQKLAELKSQTN
jgi:hypothetical protein